GAGFAVTDMEEWVSHRTSERGPRAKAEDRARREIPLFLAIKAEPQR
ncbi:MAG: SAM-dependent methyltransferase, partial [Candidatus Harrisonbacteria bacterium]|nr:SAM-dependent methyltransferase [Candidatus Harrisonbacteria bacterium]